MFTFTVCCRAVCLPVWCPMFVVHSPVYTQCRPHVVSERLMRARKPHRKLRASSQVQKLDHCEPDRTHKYLQIYSSMAIRMGCILILYSLAGWVHRALDLSAGALLSSQMGQGERGNKFFVEASSEQRHRHRRFGTVCAQGKLNKTETLNS